ncbi:glycosyltransferase family 1 protein [Bipolaris sorokiniana ND90Pr]|uniref:Glycosyltransferase family 1 protein n=1 Tax=Cochliobolus sativus (strain ND90Pr / ATCC 201652) TaxID=665912 RepID=M2SE15_COCSN|nr:glycosyltransferase family 1 protein [Bipolaris sorokiniana ND90Pr]EMD60710.1 glycosyltransferase family 1 protein [Bipolaris sorokiniana ND90Pr]
MSSPQDKGGIAPVGMVIEEPSFPNIPGHEPKTTSHATSPVEDTPAAEMVQQESVSRKDYGNGTRAPLETTPSNQDYFTQKSRPAQQQRWATERPKPSVKHSLFAKEQQPQQKRPMQPERHATITFDADTDSSDSSSDEDVYSHNKSLGHADELTTQTTRKSRPFSRLRIANEHFNTKARVSRADGRLKLSILEKNLSSGYIAKALGTIVKKHGNDEDRGPEFYNDIDATKVAPEDDEMEHDPARRVKLNIVIIIIGSRGDIQPFIRIGKILKEDYGHRVRLATHPAFRDFVEKDSGLEFFSVGGNPAELMAFMVKNPGLIPNIETIKEGEIGRRRAQMYEMFQGMWRACINATDDETDTTNVKMMGDRAPFVADAIIANPPSIAPQHIAEKLGIPLHMMFTFPYTPTSQFPHPLANIKSSNVEATYSNFISYPLVEMMMWQGLGDLINRFRTQILHLEEVSKIWAPGQLYRLKVPYTYMWSPSLIPKPKDWGPEIDISGFVFLDLASSFKPPAELQKFLDDGPPPVYIGFGSIVVDDPDAFTELIFEAVKQVGCRALVSKGWGGFGSNADCPDNVFMLENTPHDWLFPRCSAVVHHGGAGTTAIGLKCGIPTMIVPFFGDQPFWGAMVSKAKAGAHECIPYKKLTPERLAEGIKQCLTEEAKENVKKIADSIAKEGDGALNAVRSFHRSLPLSGEGSMRCDFLDNRAAVWKIKNTHVKLSALAAEILVEKKKLKWSELRLVRHYEWNDFGGPGEPITGVWGSLMSSFSDAAAGVGGMPVEIGKSIRKREKIKEKKRRLQKGNNHKKAARSEIDAGSSEEVEHDVKNQQNGSRPQPTRNETTLSKISEPSEDLADELGREAAFGFRKTGHAIARFPMEVTLAITQGFHNAPRLYGDETVRRPPRVTGFHSGTRAGRDEFLYGVRDGVSGLVMQPYHGAKKNGVMGALRGVGFGVGGFVLKDIAALLGPMAYMMKGVDAEYMKRYQPTSYLRRARIAEGQQEKLMLTSTSRNVAQQASTGSAEKKESIEEKVSVRWNALQKIIAEDKKRHKNGLVGSLTGRGDEKDGQRVGRKSTEVSRRDTRRSMSKGRANTRAPNDKPGRVHPNELDTTEGHQSAAKKSMEDKARVSMNRMNTAPTTTVERNQHGDREMLDVPLVQRGGEGRQGRNSYGLPDDDGKSESTKVGSEMNEGMSARQKVDGVAVEDGARTVHVV